MPEFLNNAGAIVAIMLLPLVIGLGLALIVERRRRLETVARLEARRASYADALKTAAVSAPRFIGNPAEQDGWARLRRRSAPSSRRSRHDQRERERRHPHAMGL